MIDRELTFDREAYSVDAVQRAAYRLSDRLSIDLIVGDDLKCAVHFLVDDEASADAALGEFRNEVLDQVLRERIRNETEGVRNVILAQAFANTGLTASDD
jgi:His-Xaa-Ser system protein HxsD